MNRIQQSTQTVDAPLRLPLPRPSLKRAVGPHSLMGPLHYEPNYAYPLIVWLHGPDDDETQVQRVMPHLSLRNYAAVGPRGASPTRDAFTWRQSPADVAVAEQRVFAAIEAAARSYHVHLGRVFLAGFDCGGTMALRVAMNHPERFAGVVSFCGCFPEGSCPLARLGELRGLPLLLATGCDSPDYPPSAVCQNLRLMHTAGMEVALRQYPCGQDVCTEMLADANRWMMEQITSGTRNGG